MHLLYQVCRRLRVLLVYSHHKAELYMLRQYDLNGGIFNSSRTFAKFTHQHVGSKEHITYHSYWWYFSLMCHCVVNSIKTAVEKVLLQLESDDRPVLVARKSHSVENILSSSDACTSNVEVSRPSSGKLPPMHFPCDVPTYRCHEASNAETPRHPGSGLSSSGSHTSLLDSPEIISVS